MAHLFLSYAHADSDHVYPFHARMQAVIGHHIWIDKVGLRQGIEWENALHRAVTTSYGVVFAVTKAFCESTYIREKEIPWAVAQFRDKQGPLLFPILFDDAPLPNTLNLPFVAHTIDARDGNYQRVFDELKAVLPKPHEGDHRFLVGWPRLLTFQGREDTLIQLHDSLMQHNGRVGVLAAMHGMGGIGKTQLAVEYAHRYRFHYPAGVFWVNAAQSWTLELAEIAKNIGLSLPDASVPDYERQMAAAFNSYLRNQDGDALIILDNVENPLDVLHNEVGPMLKMAELPAKLLVTTRRGDLPREFAALSVTTLLLEDARRVLLAARPDTEHDPAIDDICQALGYLPLALGLAAAALEKRKNLTPAKFLEYLRTLGIDEVAEKVGVELGTPKEYAARVNVALEWQWGQLESDPARQLLALASAYGEAAEIPLVRLSLLAGLKDDPNSLDQPLSDAVTELRSAALIEELITLPTAEEWERAARGLGNVYPWGYLETHAPQLSLATLSGYVHSIDRIRLHPLVRDYARRKVPDHAQQLAEGAARLVAAYRDPGTLSDEARKRGFPPLLQDLRDTRLALLPESYHDLNLLERYFNWESHHLRQWKSDEQPAYLIQHIRERAHHQSDDTLCNACDEWLTPYPHFRTSDPWRFPNDPALIRVFEGHTNKVMAVTMVDSRRALSASVDNTLRMWDVETGETLRVLEGHTSAVTAVVWMGGKRVLSGSQDGTLRLWDVETGGILRVFEGHTHTVFAITMVDSRRALSASADGTLRLWDVEIGETLRIFAGHSSAVFTVTMVDGRRALSASGDTTLRLWDVETGEVLRVLEGHDSLVMTTTMVDGRRALSASYDHTLRLWDVETGETLQVFTEDIPFIPKLKMVDRRRFLLVLSNPTLRLWDIETGKTLRDFIGHTDNVQAVTVVDSHRVLSASADNTLRLWDIEMSEPTEKYELYTTSLGVTGVAVLPDQSHILSTSWFDGLRLWNVETGETRRLPVEAEETSIFHDLAVVDGQRVLVGAGTDSADFHKEAMLILLEFATGEPLHIFRGHEGPVNAVVMVDDRLLLSASSDKSLCLWDIESRELLRVFKGHNAQVWSVSVFRDGHRAISASEDKTLRLWEINTGNEIQRFEGHSASVSQVIVLADQRHILSTSRDATLRMWDVETGDYLWSLKGQKISTMLMTDEQHVLLAQDKTLCLRYAATNDTLAMLHLNELPTCLKSLTDGSVVVGDNTGKVRILRVVLP